MRMLASLRIERNGSSYVLVASSPSGELTGSRGASYPDRRASGTTPNAGGMTLKRHAASLLAAGLVLAGLAPLAGGQSGPVLRLSTREVDFGRVDQHQQVRDEVTLRNVGDAPLRILKVVADCGCAAGTPSDSTVLPGEEVAIGVAFSTRNYKGPQKKRITLETNDPAEPKAVIDVLADVRPFVRLDRERIRFPTVRHGETPTETVVIAADEEHGLEIVSVAGAEEILDWSAKPVASPGEVAYELSFSIRPDAPPGSFRERVRIETDGPPVPGTHVIVMGTVTSYFLVEGGTRIRFPTVDAGQSDQLSIRITTDGSKPFRLLRADSSSPHLVGEIASAGGDAYVLTITLKETAPSGHFRETVTLRTTDPQQKAIELEILGRVRT
ncbi:MAG: DUF1573 domain-containing protein [Candidatus Eisenbacteria bacterium]|nr:DUF1573 domain-containing protein [Candidatus Latescibacterota bacterium]MBD3302437.1 DUF1573 domain-containing protein [Candidatus Eisenbacteria bacterium]